MAEARFQEANAIRHTRGSAKWLFPSGFYAVVRRFSSKEERRRIVANVVDPTTLRAEMIGFENHLNVLHDRRKPLAEDMARGIAVYLNATAVDQYFRRFNGHTQVNATDLRTMRYPSREALLSLGKWAKENPQPITGGSGCACNGTRMTHPHVDAARQVLADLGFPPKQRNERSALTLLALLDLRPDYTWNAATAPHMGITPIMNWFSDHYGKTYAPNTRETVRRQTMHQFVHAGLALRNPDDPVRPVNSGDTVYQIAPDALALLRRYGTAEWDTTLPRYLQQWRTLAERYAREREMNRVPVRIAEGSSISLNSRRT